MVNKIIKLAKTYFVYLAGAFIRLINNLILKKKIQNFNLVNKDQAINNKKEELSIRRHSWNDIYTTSTRFKYEDPIFNLIGDIDISNFEPICKYWLELEWFNELEENVKNEFKRILINIRENCIDRQNEVFKTEKEEEATYNFFKKSIIYLFDKVKNDKLLGSQIVLQLNLAVGQCPVAYHSAIRTALLATWDSITNENLSKDNSDCETGFHHLCAIYREQIASDMASEFGRQETHTLNSILILIGEERGIPGYNSVMPDKQQDVHEREIPNLLNFFDEKNSPSLLIDWLVKKINGKIDGKAYLHNEVQHFFLSHFSRNKNNQAVYQVIYDQEELTLKEEAIIACLETFEIIVRKNKEGETMLQKIEKQVNEALKQENEITDISD